MQIQRSVLLNLHLLFEIDVLRSCGVLSTDGLISSPFVDIIGHIDGAITSKSILSVLHALGLERPGEVAFKVKHRSTANATLLLHYIAKLDSRVCNFACRDRVSVIRVVLKIASTHPVHPSVTDIRLRWRGAWCSTEKGIDNDLRLLVSCIQALLNRVLEVDIVDSATVHENAMVLPDLWREGTWDGGRADGCPGQVIPIRVRLVKLGIDALVDFN